MNYLDALKLVHAAIKPRFYVEIGCRNGRSLSLANCHSVAIDPNPEITQSLTAPTRIFAESSDAFFARKDHNEQLGMCIDLSFIDGMHQVEYALRDFINLERCSGQASVILVDDVLPDNIDWTSRTRQGQYWTGDIYRLIPILRQYRPDLDIAVFDVEIKGLAVITNLDPVNTVLADALDEIQALVDQGKWMVTTTIEISDALRPRSCDELPSYLNGLTKPVHINENPKVRFLELLKNSILNKIYLDDELRIIYLRECLDNNEAYSYSTLHDISKSFPERFRQLTESRENGMFLDRKITNSGFSHSMMGQKRLDNLHECLDMVRLNDVAGDLVECGVWRGGGCILMAGYLQVHDLVKRKVFVADSFEGLPKPVQPEDRGLDLSKEKYPQLAVDLDTVKSNFEKYDLLADNVTFLKGWFKDTLPTADIDKIALLRLDGDLYESTMDCLVALYEKVSLGGIVIVDDYGALEPCRKAIDDYFGRRNEPLPELTKVDWTAVYWIKTS